MLGSMEHYFQVSFISDSVGDHIDWSECRSSAERTKGDRRGI